MQGADCRNVPLHPDHRPAVAALGGGVRATTWASSRWLRRHFYLPSRGGAAPTAGHRLIGRETAAVDALPAVAGFKLSGCARS